MSAQFTDAKLAREFVLAGRAIFTLKSLKTGKSFTFKVTQNEGTPHFVSLLTGPSNTTDYQFLGTIFDQRTYVHGRKSKITPDAPSARAFQWVWTWLVAGKLPSTVLEVYHEDRCGRCGRTLTVVESVVRGMGPICESKVEM
jgi:hypothetical protein